MIKSQFLRKSFVTLPLIIYLIINGLFAIKYGPFGLAGNTVLFGIYSVFILLAFVFFNRIELRTVYLKYFFWAIVAVFFLFTLILNHYVKLESLNVDRLDALDMGVEAVLNG